MARARPPTQLVQEPAVPVPDGTRAPRGACGDGLRRARRGRDQSVGLQRRNALPRAARSPVGHGRRERGRARGNGHARRDDRRGATVSELVRPEVRRMTGEAALPRQNGELVFDAPWQGRVLGMALAVVQQRGLEWDDFRGRLIAAIDADPSRPYYESWTAALTGLVVDLGGASAGEVDSRAAHVEA